MILDKIENWKTYAGLGPGIARGLELLAGGKLDALAEGRHELEGEDLFASVQVYLPKVPGDCRWEAHRKYIDIQFVVSGCEAMGCCPVGSLPVAEPYDPELDVAFFTSGPEVGNVVRVEAKMFVVFFPTDAHMPGLAPGRPPIHLDRVKKIVIKVKLQ